jgi:DNA-binding LytR/AlgR family response regulator
MDNKYTALIVDDEPEARDFLSSQLSSTSPEIRIVGFAGTSSEATEKYFSLKPQLIFMDIHLDDKTGMDVIQEIYDRGAKPYIIFITAFDKHAVEAFRKDAIDYLLKPVEPEELKSAVQKFIKLQNKDQQFNRVLEFLDNTRRKIRFNTREGFILYHPDDIIYVEAAQNYSKIFSGKEKHEVISMNLGKVEDLLPADQFWRISKSHIINSKYLFRVDRKKRECILVKEDLTITLKLSRERLKNMPG